MLEVFYIILLVVFGGLIVVTLTQYGIRSGALKDELERLREKIEHQEARLKVASEASDTIALDPEILQGEKGSLEAQEICMGNLDQFNMTPISDKSKRGD